MNWRDEGYLLSKRNFDENSIIIECFTYSHGKYSGIVYGGSSRRKKTIFQVGNKILLNYKSKNQNKIGYFTTELIQPVSAKYFDDKKRSICILAAASFLKILLPERQINKKIYNSFEKMTNQFYLDDWIKIYIYWELSLVKELGYEVILPDKGILGDTISKNIEINEKYFKVPDLLLNHSSKVFSNADIREALLFNKNIILENFIKPYNLKIPNSRNILEKYFI